MEDAGAPLLQLRVEEIDRLDAIGIEVGVEAGAVTSLVRLDRALLACTTTISTLSRYSVANGSSAS